MTAVTSQLPILDLAVSEWERWLAANHATAVAGVWLRILNKNAAQPGLSYEQAVEVALCFGWIDGQVRAFDEVSRIQRFTPRRRASVWSKINTERAQRLIDSGRMRPAGRRCVEEAKADGRWAKAYDPPSDAEPPEDLLVALTANERAARFYATLNKRNTYAITYRLQTARTPQTRERRLRVIIDKLAREEKLHD